MKTTTRRRTTKSSERIWGKERTPSEVSCVSELQQNLCWPLCPISVTNVYALPLTKQEKDVESNAPDNEAKAELVEDGTTKVNTSGGTSLRLPHLLPNSDSRQSNRLTCLICGSTSDRRMHYSRTGHCLFFHSSYRYIWSGELKCKVKPTTAYPAVSCLTLY